MISSEPKALPRAVVEIRSGARAGVGAGPRPAPTSLFLKQLHHPEETPQNRARLQTDLEAWRREGSSRILKRATRQQPLLSEPTLEILFKPNCQPATGAAAQTVMCEQTRALQSSGLGDCSFILLRFSDRWHRFPLNSSVSFGI
ncbi:hypothetical protein D4764_01G0020310 [Takifugu flavidus]|uniref:Uncharacterized protein n=1 Tax=Takifugu flavidus TaxID=433684 RepID=A0A5C6PT74_9TELE|nr:hypothetical protein D4764_01G0020310 [Takifugu flavidus]